MVTDPRIWKMLGYSAVPRAVQLPTFNLKLDPVSRVGLPTFPVNLLIQAKRPSRMVRVPPSFRGHLVTPHFRIGFEAHQHRTLHRLQKRLANRAVVAYAAPVFSDWASLHHNIQVGSLVQSSTFPTLRRLGKHTEWRYDRPGCVGCGHSTPEFIDEPDLFAQIRQARDRLVPEPNVLASAEPISDLATVTYDRIGRIARELYVGGTLPFSREDLRSLRRTFGPEATAYFGLQVTFARLGLIWAIA